MSKQDNLTLIISCSAHRPARRLRIPRVLTRIALMGLAVALMSFLLSTLHYYRMWKKTAAYDSLKLEADQLHKENETFRLAAKQLSEKISSLEVTSKKLQVLSGLEREGLGGVGGPLNYDNPLLQLNRRGLIQHFHSLERKRISLDSQLKQLQEWYNTRSILAAATPAIMPVRGYPSGHFGYRLDPFSGKRDFHPGIDISAPQGNKVTATADGTVVFARRKLGYGKLVVLNHRFGISTLYGHLERYSVKSGQGIKKGDILGYVGSTGRATGPHLHYEVRFYGQPLNPLRFLRH